MALAGVIMMMVAKSNKRKNVGAVLVGFAILMFGMEVMSDSMSPLAGMPEFQQVLTMFNNPIFGVLIGLIIKKSINNGMLIGIIFGVVNGLIMGVLLGRE